MGASASIQNTEYDEAKFQESKAILEAEGIEDQEKFIKLKAIWEPATTTGTTDSPAADTVPTTGDDDVPKVEQPVEPAVTVMPTEPTSG